MLRLIIVFAFVVIFLIVSIPIWGILAIVGLFNKDAKDKAGFAIVKWAFHIVWLLSGVKPTIQGLENVPNDEPVLYVANHQGLFDVVLAYSLCPSVTGFMSKTTFAKVPLLSVWMKLLYCVFLTRDNPREDLKQILATIDYVKKGISIFVFPEGTRSKTGEMAAFHEAPMKIATKTGCKVVPVAISGTRDVFENHMPFIKGHKVVMTFCDPIDPKALEGDDKKFFAAYCQKIIAAQLEEDSFLLK